MKPKEKHKGTRKAVRCNNGDSEVALMAKCRLVGDRPVFETSPKIHPPQMMLNGKIYTLNSGRKFIPTPPRVYPIEHFEKVNELAVTEKTTAAIKDVANEYGYDVANFTRAYYRALPKLRRNTLAPVSQFR